MKTSLEVALGGEAVTLLGSGVAFSASRGWLVVADAHFGKAAAFRARGVPVPHGTTVENLRRLDAVIEHARARRLIFLGDLFHAAESHAPATLAAMRGWRERRRSLDLVLVEGNHDRRAGAPPADLGIRVEQEPWCVDGLAFCHHPQFVRGRHVIAGHLHPAVRLFGRADDTVRLPCFWLRDGLAVLPAFGGFTGGARIEREDGDRVIAIAEGRLYEVPALRDAA